MVTACRALHPFDHDGLPGLSSEQEAFRSVAPGVAVEVTVDPDRYGPRALLRTACGVIEAGEAAS